MPPYRTHTLLYMFVYVLYVYENEKNNLENLNEILFVVAAKRKPPSTGE